MLFPKVGIDNKADVSEIMKLLVFINIQALLPFFKEPAENILESYKRGNSNAWNTNICRVSPKRVANIKCSLKLYNKLVFISFGSTIVY